MWSTLNFFLPNSPFRMNSKSILLSLLPMRMVRIGLCETSATNGEIQRRDVCLRMICSLQRRLNCKMSCIYISSWMKTWILAQYKLLAEKWSPTLPQIWRVSPLSIFCFLPSIMNRECSVVCQTIHGNWDAELSVCTIIQSLKNLCYTIYKVGTVFLLSPSLYIWLDRKVRKRRNGCYFDGTNWSTTEYDTTPLTQFTLQVLVLFDPLLSLVAIHRRSVFISSEIYGKLFCPIRHSTIVNFSIFHYS